MTDEGEVGNLEEFTILALEHWQEAVDLFKSEDFSRVFLINKIYAHIYEKLIKAKNPHQAMEEFLRRCLHMLFCAAFARKRSEQAADDAVFVRSRSYMW